MPISKKTDEVTFNDGVLAVCECKENKITRTKAQRIRFGEKTVGVTRFFRAKVASDKIDRLIRLPKNPLIVRGDILLIENEQYKIIQMQPKDTCPPSLDLSIERLVVLKKDLREVKNE